MTTSTTIAIPYGEYIYLELKALTGFIAKAKQTNETNLVRLQEWTEYYEKKTFWEKIKDIFLEPVRYNLDYLSESIAISERVMNRAQDAINSIVNTDVDKVVYVPLVQYRKMKNVEEWIDELAWKMGHYAFWIIPEPPKK